ncbi:MAG: 6,7-dimethyl-8-ribityllumazine synthase [Elusimicrobiota bacterium]|jgi:6,7-dimethyl-8-ribityllumazine synthase|nr:6,7-dimethyl-8-ribityllumazine synthase [Elusimicrobiota bacterium]
MKIISGDLKAEGKKIALIVSRFNEFITNKLVSGAEDILKRHGAKDADITVIWVPGAFEIAAMAKRAAQKGGFDSIICLGCVIRGATPHFDYISAEVSKGVAAVSMQYEIPVVFGVLTTDNIEQAIERAGTKAGNKGSDAALSAIEMMNLFEKI